MNSKASMKAQEGQHLFWTAPSCSIKVRDSEDLHYLTRTAPPVNQAKVHEGWHLPLKVSIF